MTITIRDATPADTGTIMRFVRELAEYERASDAVKATAVDFERVLFGPRPYAEAVIAEDGGTPLGFALFFHNFSTWEGRPGLYLEDLYVTPDARGRGVGRRLLSHLAKIAVTRGCARFEWAVLDWNEPAIRFYRSLGAVPMDEWQVNRMSGDALVALANS